MCAFVKKHTLAILRKIFGTTQLKEKVELLNEQNRDIILKLDDIRQRQEDFWRIQAFESAYAMHNVLNENAIFDQNKFDALLSVNMQFLGDARYIYSLEKRDIFRDKWLKENPDGTKYLDIKGVKLTGKIPDSPEHGPTVLRGIIKRSLLNHIFFDDCYDKRVVELLESKMGEGPRCYTDDGFNVTVEPGDIVVDAGAWVGDFSAYAAFKGASVYAFEPTPSTYQLLCETAALNENKIIPVKMALSDANGEADFLFFDDSARNKFTISAHKDLNPIIAEQSLQTICLDTFVEENTISRIDFIKADIQGAERDMLKGAAAVLRKFAPRLAIATDHLPDDPKVLSEIIMTANPKYVVRQTRTMLFAAVLEN